MASKKVILAILMATVIASGCTDSNADVTAAAEALPQVQEFLDENPDAEITAVRWNSDYLQDNQDQIPEKCRPAIEMEKDHYKVDIQDEEEQINVWLGAEQKEVMCIKREGSENNTESNSSSDINSESGQQCEDRTLDVNVDTSGPTPIANIKQVSGDAGVGNITVTWNWENRNSTKNSTDYNTQISKNRGVTSINSGIHGTFSDIKVQKVDCEDASDGSR